MKLSAYLLTFLLLKWVYSGVRFFSGDEGVQLGFLVQIGDNNFFNVVRFETWTQRFYIFVTLKFPHEPSKVF